MAAARVLLSALMSFVVLTALLLTAPLLAGKRASKFLTAAALACVDVVEDELRKVKGVYN
jgi:hypothetical protein